MKKFIVLLDVDETLALSNKHFVQNDLGYRYNQALIAALKVLGLTEVYLFTSYSLRIIAPDHAIEPTTTPSRLKLIQYLAAQGITVLGVLTIMDVEYRQGPGAYYEKVIKPFETLVLQGVDVAKGEHKKAFEALCIEEEVLREAGYKNKVDKKIDGKVGLYHYFMKHLEQEFCQVDGCIIVDDSKGVVGDFRSIQTNEPLLTILARPQLTDKNYQEEITTFFYGITWRELKNKTAWLHTLQSQQDLKILGEQQLPNNLRGADEQLIVFEKKQNEEALQSLVHKVEQLSYITIKSLNQQPSKQGGDLARVQTSDYAVGSGGQAKFQIKVQAADKKLVQENPSVVLDVKKNAEVDMTTFAEATAKLCGTDFETQKLLLEILKLAEPKRLDVAQARVLGLFQPFYISIANARKILSQNERGILEKNNIYGNNPVSRIGNVYYKQNPERFLTEQAVYQMSLLLGGGIITPSRLILVEIPNEDKITVQASLAVEGENLEDVLYLPGGIASLKQRLGTERFIHDFPGLLKGHYLSDWLAKRKLDMKMTCEAQLQLLADTLFALPIPERPLDFKDPKLTRANLEKKLFESRLKGAPILATLALMACYPSLVPGMHLADLLHLPDLFTLLQKLYPKDSSNNILKLLPDLFQSFAPDNISKHFLLALLSEPLDHKGDNFKVKVHHDTSGKLQLLEIIGIDNDMSGIDNELGMEGSIRVQKPYALRERAAQLNKEADELQYNINVKTIFYGVREFLGRKLDASVQQLLLGQSAQVCTIQWLGNMWLQVQHYLPILTRGLHQAHRLDKQLLENFSNRFTTNINRIQALIKVNPALTHKMLFLEIEPLLGRYCDELLKDYGDSQAFVLALYDEKHIPPLKKLLAERLKEKLSNGKSLQEHLSQIVPLVPVFSSYEKSFKQFAWQHRLLLEPSQLKGEILNLLLAFRNSQQEEVIDKYPLHVLAPQPLCISLEAFTELYQQQGQAFIELVKAFPKLNFLFYDTVKTTSDGANSSKPNIIISLEDATLLYRVIRNNRSNQYLNRGLNSGQSIALLLKGLLLLGASTKILKNGLSLLHYAADNCSDAMIPLIEAGFDVFQKDKEDKTPLDYAIEAPNLPSIAVLLAYEAGRSIKLDNALVFIQHYSAQVYLCQQLLFQNQDLAWNIALKNASQENETEEGVRLEGLGGRKFLKSELCKQIFKKGVSAGFQKENLYGRHNVISIRTRINENISVGLHLKENPELPGREIMVHYLAKQLFGSITPSVALWRFSKLEGWWKKTNVAYPILASRSIEGNNLREVLDHFPHQLQYLEPESVSEAIILALLISPEDGRADNYILQRVMIDNKMQYRIVSIDNDHTFVQSLALDKEGQEKEETEGLQVKSILFCLDQMQLPVHARVRKRLLSINAYEMLDRWLKDLELEQKQINQLFDLNERKRLKEAGIYVDIEFKPSIVIDIYEKLLRIQAALGKYPRCTGLALLRHSIPKLSLRYITAFEQFPSGQLTSVDERFNALTKGCFDKVLMRLPTETALFIWPNSKVALHQAPGIQDHAIVFIREHVDTFAALQAYFVRNGQWVTAMSKSQVLVLKSVPVDFRTLAALKVNSEGLVVKNKHNQEEVERIIQQVMSRMQLNKEIEFSKSKAVNIIDMTKVKLAQDLKMANEREETPARAGKILKETHELASKLKSIRDQLQDGKTQAFLSLELSEHREQIVNGKDGEFPGIDFAKMKFGNNQLDMGKQQTVLNAFAKVEFLTLRLQNCEALSNQLLATVLKNSKALLALSLVNCSKLTVASISIIKKSCPNLEKLELIGLNLSRVIESFPSLRVLRIKDCAKLSVWGGECFALQKLNIVDCPLMLKNAEFFTQYPFLLFLSKYSIKNMNSVDALLQTILTEKKASVNDIPVKFKQKIGMILNQYYAACSEIDAHLKIKSSFYLPNALAKVKDHDLNTREKSAKVVADLSLWMSEGQIKEIIESLLRAQDYWWVSDESESKEIRDRVGEEITYPKSWRYLSACLPEEQVEVAVRILLDILKKSNEDNKKTVILAIGDFSVRLSAGQITDLYKELLNVIKGKGRREGYIRAVTIRVLLKLSSKLSESQIKEIVETLLNIQNDQFEVRANIAKALGDLSTRLPAELIKVVFECLMDAIKDQVSFVGCNAIIALGKLAARLSDDQLKGVIEFLLNYQEKNDVYICASINQALGDLGARLPGEHIINVSEYLLNAQVGKKVRIGISDSADKALGDLGARLPDGQLMKVIIHLLNAQNGFGFGSKATQKALGDLGIRLQKGQLKEVIEVYLKNLNQFNFDKVFAKVLCYFITTLKEGQVEVAFEVLLNVLQKSIVEGLKKISDLNHVLLLRRIVSRVLRDLSTQLTEEQSNGASVALLKALNTQNKYIKEVVVRVLGGFAKQLPGLSEGEVKQIFEALLNVLKNGVGSEREAAARALGNLVAHFSEEQIKEIIQTLLDALKDPKELYSFSELGNTAAKVLGNLSAQLSDGQVKEIIQIILNRLKNKSVGIPAAEVLGDLIIRLSEKQGFEKIVEDLLSILKNKNQYSRLGTGDISKVLGIINKSLTDGQVEEVIAVLFNNLKDEELFIGRSDRVVATLVDFVIKLPERQTKRLIGDLLAAVKGGEDFVRFSALNVLVKLAARLSDGQTKKLIEGLLNALNDQKNPLPGQRAAVALGNLAAQLQGEQRVVEALLNSLRVQNVFVRHAVANALEDLRAHLPVQHSHTMTKLLIKALNDKSFLDNIPTLISMLVHFVGTEYFDTVVASSIKETLSNLEKTLPLHSVKNTRPTLFQQKEKLGKYILNTFIAYQNYQDKFGIQVCNLIADYAYSPANPIDELLGRKDPRKLI